MSARSRTRASLSMRPVSTPFGPVAIGSIVEGGLIGLEVFDGTDEGQGTTRVVAVAENGVKPVFRVILKNGAALEATGDHLVLASRETPRVKQNGCLWTSCRRECGCGFPLPAR